MVEDEDLTTYVDMTAYVDGLEVKQTFTRWSDKVTKLPCLEDETDPDSVITCSVLVYSLIYVSDFSTVPSDLAVIISTAEPPYIKVKVTNYDHCGTHQVRVRGDMMRSGASVSYAEGNNFNIIVDCCSTYSCLYTQLVEHDPLTDSLPTDYSIGVNNVVGQTVFSFITNTCAIGCGTNDYICGYPSYTLEMTDGSPVPSFLNTLSPAVVDPFTTATDFTHSA